MTVPGAGFLTSFNPGVSLTLINHSTKCGVKFAEVIYDVQELIDTLPDGTNVYYNGTADATITPIKASQVIFVTTGAATFFDGLAAVTGHYGTLTHDDETWTAIALQPRRLGPHEMSNTDSMTIIAEFALISE